MLPGERHRIGEFFETKDCGGYCRCTSPDSVGCVSLCPPHGIFCLPGTRKVRTVIPAFRGSKCTCPSWKCVKGEFAFSRNFALCRKYENVPFYIHAAYCISIARLTF